MKKAHREIKKIAQRHNAEMEYLTNGHIRLTFPNERQLTTAGSGAQWEISLKNLRRDIRKYVYAKKPST